jgi:hypothetical protein
MSVVMIPIQGDRILFLNDEGRLRAGCVEDSMENADQHLLFVSTEAGTQWVPVQRLQAVVTLTAKAPTLFDADWL